jgi:2-dehydro-3-deoxyphosphogluconate aldolase/(4S)-4-hydroxy-2-oxoglutarate aldolase
MSDCLAAIARHRVVPVIVCDSPQHADPLADALAEGGLPVAEVTLRTPAALDVIAQLARKPQLLVGAGTVLTVADAKRAIESGAQFVVSPGFDRQVVDYCLAARVTVLPGVATATELQQALAAGVEVVKFFPAEAIGGTTLLKALAAPFPQLRFVPTGGIDAENLHHYLSIPAVLACGGSWMVRRDWINGGDFAAVAAATRAAVELAQSVG